MKVANTIATMAAALLLMACNGGVTPTFDPQKDAEQIVLEQLEVMNSDKTPQEGMEEIQELAHSYREAYEKAGKEKEFIEMSSLVVELSEGKYKEDFDKAHQRIIERYGGK